MNTSALASESFSAKSERFDVASVYYLPVLMCLLKEKYSVITNKQKFSETGLLSSELF